MKKFQNLLLCVILLGLISLLLGCSSLSSKNENIEVDMKKYYTIDDFNSICIGKSSYKDVYEIASTDAMQITSYGGFCEYPTKEGGCVRIKFFGKDLIVGNIEEVDNAK